MEWEMIPIVFASDENYILPVAVAIYSLLRNGLKNRHTPILVLTDGQISYDGLDLLNILKREFPDCCLRVLTIEKNILLNAKIKNEGMTKTTLYRLLLPSILPHYKQCIYLDGDIIVLRDIMTLIDMDMSGKYLAGVLDKEVQKRKEYAKEIGLPLSEYINAGVLVINLELLRKFEKEKEFLSQISVGYFFADQDILNKCCFGKIKFLSMEYNWFTKYSRKGRTISILHYAGGKLERPWLNNRTQEAEIWWEYASLFEKSPIYQMLYQKAKMISKSRSFRYILEYCRDYQIIYIWGYTKYGRDLLDGLNRNGVCCVAGFIDNNPDKQKEVYRDVKVYSSEAVEYGEECLIINVAQRNRVSVNLFLKEKGVKEANILQYYIKSANYFQVLDEGYFIEEFRDYILKEYGVDRKL